MKKQSQSSPEQSSVANAITKYTQLLADNPEKAELHANLGSLYAQKQQWQDAINCYEQAIKLNPDFAGVYRNLARVFLQIGKEGKALECWYHALRLEPDWADPQQHYTLGNTLWKCQKIGKAIACYRQAIRLKPDFFLAYQSLGKLLTIREKFPQAIAVYRQAVRQNPDNPQFRFCLGQALAQQQQWQQAIVQYRKATEVDENFAVGYYGWGTALTQQQQWQQAIVQYKKAIQLQPNYWEAYHQLGNALQQQEKSAQAIAAYQNTLKINPDFVPAYLQLGEVCQHQGQYQQAIKYYRQAIELAPELSEIEQRAIAAYKQTVETNPESTFQHYHQLAILLRSKSFFSETISAYQKAIELNPHFAGAYLGIQYTPVAPEQLAQLIKLYRSIVERYPDLALAWGNLGDALTERGNIEEAISCYQTSCYYRVINLYPQLAELDWQKPKQNAPDFLIIGAAKCGTSSVYNYLSHHPQILLPHKKEIDFFWKRSEHGIDWYLAQFPALSDLPDFITGEATPNYIRFPIVAERIKEHFPQTKLIVLLRNPVERAVSWHYHKLKSGLTTGTFAEAVAQEMKQLESFSEEDLSQKGYHNPDNILGSLYLYKLKVWMELFDREQFCIIRSEDLYAHPARVMKTVYSFLDLSEQPLSEYPQVNAGSYEPISDELRKILTNYFQPHNQKLEEYLGMKLNWD